jgi:hypothetical protein
VRTIGVVSMSIALGIATLVAWLLGGWGAWILAPFLGILAFIILSGLEMAFAGWHHNAGGVGGDGDG